MVGIGTNIIQCAKYAILRITGRVRVVNITWKLYIDFGKYITLIKVTLKVEGHRDCKGRVELMVLF